MSRPTAARPTAVSSFRSISTLLALAMVGTGCAQPVTEAGTGAGTEPAHAAGAGFNGHLVAAEAPRGDRPWSWAVRNGQPVEYGMVRWSRDLSTSTASAARSTKPIALVFQEVPGCKTCQDFGTDVLAHPLLVEAFETLFEPVLIHNNTEGDRDAAVRKAFDEPAWNNPVLRILDAGHKDLTPRVHSDWTVAAVSDAMIQALDAHGQQAPLWLQALRDEHRSHQRGTQTETFAMHCFWEGEVALGGLPGVVATKAGWLDGKEVVDVEYDPGVLSYEQLLRAAQRMECASTVYVRDAALMTTARDLAGVHARTAPGITRADQDPKYHLGRTDLRHVPMTPLQAARVNAEILKSPTTATRWLSPRQLDLQKLTSQAQEAPPIVVDQDFLPAWHKIVAPLGWRTPAVDQRDR